MLTNGDLCSSAVTHSFLLPTFRDNLSVKPQVLDCLTLQGGTYTVSPDTSPTTYQSTQLEIPRYLVSNTGRYLTQDWLSVLTSLNVTVNCHLNKFTLYRHFAARLFNCWFTELFQDKQTSCGATTLAFPSQVFRAAGNIFVLWQPAGWYTNGDRTLR
jgi:hypothetical protein